MSEWIDINERRPPVGERVLFVDATGYRRITSMEVNNATHWMPLPAPPPKRIDPHDAIPGRWYLSKDWGRVLCVGSAGMKWLPGFAIRNDIGQTELKFLDERSSLYETEIQSWKEK